MSQGGTVSLIQISVDPINRTESNNLGAAEDTVAVNAQGTGQIVWEVGAGLTGTVTFEATLDDATWFPTNVIVVNASSEVASVVLTGSASRGHFADSGYSKVRMRVSAYTSGSATGRLAASVGGSAAGAAAAGSGGTEFNEDDAAAGGEAGPQILGVRRDADTSPVSTDGDFHTLIFDDAGNLKVVVKQQVPLANPILDYVTSASLAAGASVDLDGSTISAATTGKLLKVEVSCSVPCKWVVKTRDGAVEVIKAVIFTSGVTGGRPAHTLEFADPEMVTLAGAGVDENFRVTATNLDAFQSADVYATIEWDEV